jgi:tetratricopeptide (TPR) repeat protein
MSSSLLALVLAASLGATTVPQTARSALARGQQALQGKRHAVAEKEYRKALEAAPGWAAAHEGLGRAHFLQGRGPEALRELEAAVAADPGLAAAWLNLGHVAGVTGDASRAAVALAHYTRLVPGDPDGHWALAEAARQAGLGSQALEAYRSYVRLETRPSEKAFVARAQEHVGALEALLARGRGIRPGAAEGQSTAADRVDNAQLAKRSLDRGDAFMRQRSYRQAAFAYQDALHAEPRNVEGLFKLGNAYAVLGYYRQAMGRWTKASALTSDPAVKKSAADNLRRAEEKLATEGGSPQAMGRLTGTGPLPEPVRARARASYEQAVKRIGARDYEAALEALNSAIQDEPDLAVAFVARGSAHVGQHRFSEAAADYHHALRLAPELASPVYGLAETYRAVGRTAEARALYRRYAASAAADARPELQAEARKKAEALK